MAQKQNTQRITLPIYDLCCGGGGALTVERALAKVPGVLRVYANPATELAYIDYDPSLVDLPQLVAAIESVGYRAGQPHER